MEKHSFISSVDNNNDVGFKKSKEQRRQRRHHIQLESSNKRKTSLLFLVVICSILCIGTAYNGCYKKYACFVPAARGRKMTTTSSEISVMSFFSSSSFPRRTSLFSKPSSASSDSSLPPSPVSSKAGLSPALFPIEDETEVATELSSTTGNDEVNFYDIDYISGDIDDDKYSDNSNEFIINGIDYTRDEDEMLTEREDRFYINETGEKRKIETCVLVGVEDLSLKRKRRKEQKQNQQQPINNEYNFYDDNINLNNNPVADIDYYNYDDNEHFTLEESLIEMRELITTAGMELVGEITQRLQEVNPKTYIGTGKVLEVNELLQQHDCNTIVFDAELTPGQQKALENAFNKNLIQNDFLTSDIEIKVVDRTALILDIFAQHAKTREGKLQVDLALHEYRKPRLTKMWTHLERQSGAGGVGLRGPGESQLEIDKRLLRDRIITLKNKIDDVQKQRTIHRRNRIRTNLPILSLIGYTNAGKSTLLNFLTRAGVMAESMLFATLDPTTRKVKLPGYKTSPEVLLTDTVGFIQKLPTHLVAAFRATLEEVKEADVLIHVIDVSNPTWRKQENSVLEVLNDILDEKEEKTIVRVLNKIDLLDPAEVDLIRIEAATDDKNMYTVAVSSLQGDGMKDFVAVVEEALQDLLVKIELILPYSKGDELNSIHEKGHVELIDYRAEGTYIVARVPKNIAMRCEKYAVVDS